MKRMILGLALSTVVSGLTCAELAFAKKVKNKYGVVENGKMPQKNLEDLSRDVQKTLGNMDQRHYEDIVADPSQARNDQEKVAALSAREIFILVDRSGSMNAKDDNPSGVFSSGWTRWDSARVAAESISELAIALDADNTIDIMLWDGNQYGQLNSRYETMTQVGEIQKFFEQNKPQRGSTPLAEALTKVYEDKLSTLLHNSEPFTVVILTDGQPNNPNAVKKFFKRIIQENNLESFGRETLAAFSFIRMGDDPNAEAFLQDLDDNLIRQLNVKVDIVDTKEDNFLFGTGKYTNLEAVGPFAMFWDAIYD